MTTINDVISWKHEPNEKFGSHYIFFFVNTENNLISKLMALIELIKI